MEKQNIKNLDWDTMFFGYKVAKLEGPLDATFLSASLQTLTTEGVRIAYWFVEPTDDAANAAAKELGGVLVDEKITFAREVNNDLSQPELNEWEAMVSYINRDYLPVLDLALQSGEYSRFKSDPHFKNCEFERLYSEWIRKSVSGELAFEVLVFESEGKPSGLITLENRGEYGNIGLLSVDRVFRRQGIATKLVQEALIIFRNKGITVVKVPTQLQNEAACAFYQKLGFTEENSVNIYHFWLYEK